MRSTSGKAIVNFVSKVWFKLFQALLLGCLLLGVMAQASAADSIAAGELPSEARQTLALIKQGGPYPYSKDGVVFGNYEHALPPHQRGYYHEYTVKTPGVRGRGAQRIIVGGGSEYFYTNDHYSTFRRIRE
jgi:ribonuclease T1